MAAWCAEFPLVLNGRPVQVSGIAPQTTLLEFVRSRGLTGSKEGCAEGECGACAVLLVSARGEGSFYRAVNSCLIPLPAMAGREIVTVEGISEDGGLAEVQRAMMRLGGSQCGYCTPGFVVSMLAGQYQSESRDPHSLGGNLCRCTGYRPIADAFQSLGAPAAGPLRDRMARPVVRGSALQYETGEGRFSRPANLSECFDLMEADAEARFVAGNTDYGVETNLRDRRFAHLVSLENLEELRGFADGPDAVEIGAGLTLSEIEERWVQAPAVMGEWLALFASPLIRNRATLGGNLATASPIGDSAPLLMAMGAEVVIEGRSGARTVPLHEFFLSYRVTALARGEVLRSVRIPKPFPGEIRFYKVAKRRMDDISTVAAGIGLTRDGDGRITQARVAFGGVAAVPMRAREVEEALERGERWDLRLNPISDHRGSAAYRLAMAGNLLEKGLAG